MTCRGTLKPIYKLRVLIVEYLNNDNKCEGDINRGDQVSVVLMLVEEVVLISIVLKMLLQLLSLLLQVRRETVIDIIKER